MILDTKYLFVAVIVLAIIIMISRTAGQDYISGEEGREEAADVITEVVPKVSQKDVPKPEQFPGTEGWRFATATVFWVGEKASEENDFIANDASVWNTRWQESYGGVDDPNCRDGYHPCDFTPQENPFYIALPYNDYEDESGQKPSAKHVPWNSTTSTHTLLKNRWVEVRVSGTSCYGQWEDVGPNGEDNWEYVFGDEKNPSNTFGLLAGIDLSPAMRDCLGVDGDSEVHWRHIDATKVPHGPWTEIITRSGSQYE